MTAASIWITALVAYALFWCWYVGFKRRITSEEVEEITALLRDHAETISDRQIDSVRRFLSNDDGKDFVMVNLLHLKDPQAESRKKLEAYMKVFLGGLLRRAGHPVFQARAAAGNIENVGCEHADGWTAAGVVRYRSRRDFLEILPATIGSEHHTLKLEALEKTLAFPSSSWFIFGGPRIVVALAIALAAALAQLTV